MEEVKSVMVIDEELPLGLIANTAAVMGISLGKEAAEIVGENISDKSGDIHQGLIKFPIPILKGKASLIKDIKDKLKQPEFSDLLVIDFFDVAQICKTYTDFMKEIAKVSNEELKYYGIAIYGNKKLVNKLTGSLPLLR